MWEILWITLKSKERMSADSAELHQCEMCTKLICTAVNDQLDVSRLPLSYRLCLILLVSSVT